MNEHVLLCVVSVDKAVAGLDVEPLDRARDVLRNDGLHVLGLYRGGGGVVVAARDVLVGHVDLGEMAFDGRPGREKRERMTQRCGRPRERNATPRTPSRRHGGYYEQEFSKDTNDT